MIVVSVKLVSAISRDRDCELARMVIDNVGGNEKGTRANYRVRTYRGQSTEALDHRQVEHEGEVLNHKRLSLHIWHLVAKALKAVNYGEV